MAAPGSEVNNRGLNGGHGVRTTVGKILASQLNWKFYLVFYTTIVSL
jgi:hypothetical protein